MHCAKYYTLYILLGGFIENFGYIIQNLDLIKASMKFKNTIINLIKLEFLALRKNVIHSDQKLIINSN